MRRVSLTLNGAAVTAEVEPRTHLADFLREHCLLTGTHLGCEHGVCGACTLLLDGSPTRSCIAFAAACEGQDVRTIEGLEDDLVIKALRMAFTAEHALQCGYCTPGMLVTARDIVLRLPGADEARIRLELAGNLCRCTGYAGIVRAIQRVLAENVARPAMTTVALPPLTPTQVTAPARPDPTPHTPAAPAAAAGPALDLVIRIARPRAEVWAALRDPVLVASCLPGARLVRVSDGGRIEGEMRVALGPIAAVFIGAGRLTLDDAAQVAVVSGEARDSRSGTMLSGRATVALVPDNASTTRAVIGVTYVLRGVLAQLARPSVVHAVATDIAATVAGNLERRLGGEVTPVAPVQLSAFALVVRLLWRRVSRWLGLS